MYPPAIHLCCCLYLQMADACEDVMDDNTDTLSSQSQAVGDIEDMGGRTQLPTGPRVAVSHKRKRDQAGLDSQTDSQTSDLSQNWREVLGPPPPLGDTKVCSCLCVCVCACARVSVRVRKCVCLSVCPLSVSLFFSFFYLSVCLCFRDKRNVQNCTQVLSRAIFR